MSESLRSKTIKGALWAFLEKLGTQVVHFIVTIVLARLLTPADYGLIGMLTVFISISQLFIDCGFGSALIRKKDRNEIDYSTVFWYNLVVSIACYCVLYVAAPLIADFYKMPLLTRVLRIIGINLIINAMYTIQVTRLTAIVQFGLQAKVAISTAVISGVVGISMAYFGCGVWALVGQAMSVALISAIAFWSFSGWHPSLRFSWGAFRNLFGFGSRIMAASSLHTIYTNIAPLIIGRKYTAADLGYYSRGDGLAALPGGIFQSTLGRVIFPVLSSIQDDESRLKAAYNKYLRLITSLVAPSMLLFAACAKPVVTILIGEKWLSCVPYLQLLAIAWVCDPIIIVNLNVLYVKGRSDVVLKLEIIKKVIAISIVLVAVQFGIIWLCLGRVLYSYIALILNIYYCGPFIGMGFLRQMREVWPIYCSAVGSATIAYVLSCYLDVFLPDGPSISVVRNFVMLVVAGSVGLVFYGTVAWLLKFDIAIEGRNYLKKYFVLK